MGGEQRFPDAYSLEAEFQIHSATAEGLADVPCVKCQLLITDSQDTLSASTVIMLNAVSACVHPEA